MPVPVWAAILGIAVAKKVVVYTAAKIYGFPRLYRKSQQLARWAITDKATLKLVSGRIAYIYRVPDTFAARWFGPSAGQLAKSLPSGPVSLQHTRLSSTLSPLKTPPPTGTVRCCTPACSKGLLARTLRSGQYYFQLRGSSIPTAGLQTALRPLDISRSPAASAALNQLGRHLNFVVGHSFTGQRTFACA